MTTMKMLTKKRQTKMENLLEMLPSLPKVKVKMKPQLQQQSFRMTPIPMKEFAMDPVIWEVVKTNPCFPILI